MAGEDRPRVLSGWGPGMHAALRLLAVTAVLVCGSRGFAQTGACCNPSGACTLGTRAQCPTGACTLQFRGACQLAGSTYIGDRVACGTGSGGGAVCPIGACCLNDGACTAGLSQTDCLAIAGTFQGIASTCAVITCPTPLGACCASASCAALTLPLCSLFQGTWRGPATACGPGNTCPPVGVCCRGATCSVALGQLECVPPQPGVGARFAPGDSLCNTFGESKFPCCHADFDGSGVLSAQDIFDFLNAWFAISPFSRVGGNGVEPPTVQDIFDYLNDWFAGC